MAALWRFLCALLAIIAVLPGLGANGSAVWAEPPFVHRSVFTGPDFCLAIVVPEQGELLYSVAKGFDLPPRGSCTSYSGFVPYYGAAYTWLVGSACTSSDGSASTINYTVYQPFGVQEYNTDFQSINIDTFFRVGTLFRSNPEGIFLPITQIQCDPDVVPVPIGTIGN